MSEYQYYEFQAIDRPLTDELQQELRRISSRAHITPTGFVNVYNYGDFHADPVALLEKCFDAFCYLANWGTRQLMFRIPTDLIDGKSIRAYCLDDIFRFHQKGEFLILSFDSESEEHEWEEGEGWLSSMISLREDLIRGDFRCLYLAWLLGVQQEWVEPDEVEPPVPSGLGELNGALSTLVRFMRIDPDLVTVAARCSTGRKGSGRERELARWIHDMDSVEKDEILHRLISGHEPHLGNRLYQQFLKICALKNNESAPGQRRTAGELLKQAESCAREREKREAEEYARKQATLKKEQARERKKYLAGLTGKESDLWHQITTLIAGKRPADYDQSVRLLLDLKELAKTRSDQALFRIKVNKLCQEHRRKYSLIKRLRNSGLIK